MTSYYRFRPLNTHTIDELKNSYLYFSTIGKLNDPMECFYRLFFNGEADLYSNLFKHFLAVMRLVSIDSTLNGKASFRKDMATKAFKIKKYDKIFKDIDEWVDKNCQTTCKSLENKQICKDEIINILKEVYRRFYPQDSKHIEFKIAEYLEQLKKFAIKELLVCCFSKFEPTNERNCIYLSNDEILMWAHYASGHSGICLEFSKIIAQDRGFENDIEPKEIEYCPSGNVANIPFSLGLVLSHIEHKYQFLSRPIVIEGLQDIYNQKCESIYHKKLKVWEYEQEHRISIPKDKLKNQKLEYKIERLKSITFGKRTPFDKQKQIINFVKNKKPNIAFYKVDIDENGVFVRERMRD